MMSPDEGGGVRKKMPIEEFVERGFLQEVNRRLLHPCGLALAVEVICGGDEDGEWKLTSVWDSRNDLEGIIFDEADPPDWRKRNRVNAEWNRHIEGREGLKLHDPYEGAGVQPCPEPGEESAE